MHSPFHSVGNWCRPFLGFQPNSERAQQIRLDNSLLKRLCQIRRNALVPGVDAEGDSVAESTQTKIITAITADLAVQTGHAWGREGSR
jgi:hypothetical protein